MDDKYISTRDSFTIKDGEVKDLTVRFTGNLNKFIVDYYNDPLKSGMHKILLKVLDRVTKSPVNIRETED